MTKKNLLTEIVMEDYDQRVAEIEARLTDQGKRLYQVETRIKPMDYDHSQRITALEKLPAMIDDHIKRLADHDESIESLTETVDQLSSCKCEAVNQMLKRVGTLEIQVQNLILHSNGLMREFEKLSKSRGMLERSVDTAVGRGKPINTCKNCKFQDGNYCASKKTCYKFDQWVQK